jgi:hypothetical protein
MVLIIRYLGISRGLIWSVPVDAVSGDGHEMTLRRHHITEQGQVTIVHVQAVEVQNLQ